MTKVKKRYATHLTTPTGERLYLSARSQKELDQKLCQARMELSAGVNPADAPTFHEYALLWLKTYKSPPKLRQSSYEIVRHNLEAHVDSFFGHMKLRDITPMHVQAWLNTIAGYSNSLQSKCTQIVKSIFRTAVDNGLIIKSPVTSDVKPGGAKAREEEPLTNEQAKDLLDAVRDTRAYTLCLIALSTGMRRGEILGLMWEDIDWRNNVIHVTHNKSFPASASDAPVTELLKTDAARRDLPMSKALKAHLASEKLASASPYVLSMSDGRSLTRSSFRKTWRIVSRASERLGFSCHPHLLRHTFITMMFETGLDLKQVQYLAGHSTPDMTLRVYTHYRRRSREAETADKVSGAVAMFG